MITYMNNGPAGHDYSLLETKAGEEGLIFRAVRNGKSIVVVLSKDQARHLAQAINRWAGTEIVVLDIVGDSLTT